jgi:threonine dehydrogenase-like Zn-dependent dehydrogenase
MRFDPVGLKGHEGTSASPGTGYEIGRRVLVGVITPCGQCRACLSRQISASAATAIKITYEEAPSGEAALSCSRLATTRRPDARPV